MVVGGNPKTARESNDAIVYSELYSMVEIHTQISSTKHSSQRKSISSSPYKQPGRQYIKKS